MDPASLQIQTLSQLSRGAPWRLALAHDRGAHLLVWLTRGQGRMLLDGRRRGLGAHNAVFVPAHTLFALDLGPNMLGLTVSIPAGTPLRLPDQPLHLRIRDVHVQGELSALIEHAHREQSQARPLAQDALEAHVALMSVWLRRQMALDEHVPPPRSAGERLSQRFTRMIPAHYTSGDAMAQYAATLGVTPTHLTRAVKAATGRTAADLLTERLVHGARDLLETTPHPARNIAAHLGFRSAAYFTRFIQQHTGQPPSRLRAQAANTDMPNTATRKIPLAG